MRKTNIPFFLLIYKALAITISKGFDRLKIYRKSKNEKNDKLFKKKIKIGVSAMIGLILLVKVSRLIIIFSGDMPAMDDIYFLAYDSRTRETIIYRYDADMKKTNEVGKVAEYFHNCKIDSEKKYITGVCNLWPPEKYDDTKSEFKSGIVRYSLEDGSLTLLRSEQQMCIGNNQSIFWDSCFPFDNGEKMLMCYVDEENNFTYLLYDLATSKAKKIGMPKMNRGVCDIRKGNIWYPKRKGVMQYNAKTGELKQFLQNADVCTVSDDSRKASYFGNDNKKIFLYDTVRKKKIGTLKAGWNKAFGSLFPYSCGWDQSGNYFCYIEHFIKFFGSSDTRIKVYNLHTKTSKCIFLHRNASATVQYEFVRNAD